jgi:serine/threonine-protein kinase HipA
MKLDIHVKGKTVAQLYRERDEYHLKYLEGVNVEDFVSLTMPVREAPWIWPRDLHPFFRQNLPEGYLLSIIREEFGPLLDGTDLSLLGVLGGMSIGRVTATFEGAEPGGVLEPLNVEALLTGENTTAHFASLVRKYARAAISGAVPKFLAPEPQSNEVDVPQKSTLRTSRYIIKGSDDRTPYLGFNEFYTMEVLRRLGVVPVANARMSDDGYVLIVDRFDVDSVGYPMYGVEDACGLLGLPPNEKYATTTERVLHATQAYLPSASKRSQLKRLGWLLLTNYVVRNADCHAKNIALYYTSLADVAFTPAYDLVTTQAYPAYASNPPALPMDGRKTWAPGKTLERFFLSRLGILPREYKEMVELLCDSAVTVGNEVIAESKARAEWHEVGKQMVHAWSDGMTALRGATPSASLRSLSAAINAAGLSDRTPPDASREVIGRSELVERGGM